MKFYSTRSNSECVTSSEAILNGIAKDGGLYVPQELPHISIKNVDLLKMDYRELAFFILKSFFTDFHQTDLVECIQEAYNEKFEFKEIAPVNDILGISFLELQHGPTQAFKDMALSILPHLMKKSLEIQHNKNKVVILAATSGDTGKAALEGFSGIPDILVIVFYPKDGVSEIQKRQMLTQQGNNTYVIGLEGNFDDAQTGVKAIFNDNEFNDFLNLNHFELSSANSINIGRLIPQIVYYFHGYMQMCRTCQINVGDPINVVVPTGNFGNILAAYYAKTMGLPINKFICASNENNVLVDFFNYGIYDRNRELKLTISPSMDILVSSNLERLLYEISGHDTTLISELMHNLKTNGKYELAKGMKENLKDFYSNFASEDEIKQSIYNVFKNSGHLLDPHTAVAYAVYEKYLLETGDTTKTMIVATASPYKFGKSVLSALGQNFEVCDEFVINDKLSAFTTTNIPIALKALAQKPILHETTCSIDLMKTKIKDIILNNIGD